MKRRTSALFLAPFLLASITPIYLTYAGSPDAVVGFNEIQYNPVGVAEDGEWVEVFNQMGIRTDMSGWSIKGIGYTFPPGTIIDPGEYLVVYRNPVADQLGPYSGSLDNSGELLELTNQGDRLMDELNFRDSGRWPLESDGSGATLAKRNPSSANKPIENWTYSSQVGGTPGRANFPDTNMDAAPQILINEIPPASETTFWIELINAGAEAVNISGFIVSVAGDPAREYDMPAQSLAAGGVLLLDESVLGFRPADNENLFLYDANKTMVLDGQAQTGRLRGRSGQHDGAWLYPDSPTPGALNVFTFHDEVVISEIAYNPPAVLGTRDTPATFQSSELFGFNVDWRYNDKNENMPANWANSFHSTGGNWTLAGAPIGRESSVLSIPLVTDLNPTYTSATVTYYFERDFNLTAQQLAGADSMQITHQIDDGAIFYMNGKKVGVFNMTTGTVNPETLANPTVTNAAIATLSISADSLVTGTNRLSVEVHQTSTGSSDIVFGVKLDIRFLDTPFIPGLPFRNSNNQWLEIANRSGNSVDLSGWDFGDGISFDFPARTMLAAGEHACIARDAADFTVAFPAARLLGEFDGRLSRTGEHLLLRDANNNPVDDIRYFDSGRWPDSPDGGGATLELRDLDADNSAAESWTASDESDKSSWKTYTYQGVAAPSAVGPDNQWRDFIIGLNDGGEVLIDDIMITESPGVSRVAMLSNSDFEGGATGWRFRGNHRHSEVITDPDNPGNQVLRLVATGYTEHMHNNVESTLANGRSVVNGRTYEISFKAKWISGSNQFLTRLYFNRLPRTTLIDRSDTPGTPGLANSRAEANIGPTHEGLSHSPPVPPAGVLTTVSVTPSDPDGIGTLTLFYSVKGGAFSTVVMVPDPGGVYSAQIPGQAAGAVVQFYIAATDGLGVSSFFPAGGKDSRALYQVEDDRASGTGLHNFRLIMTPADDTWMHTNINVMSNDRLGSTVIYNESEIFYDTGVRIKSSQRGRLNSRRLGFSVRFNADQLFRGVHRTVAIDRSQGQSPGQRELLFNIMMTSAGGTSGKYNDLIKIIAPRNAHTGTAELQLARYGGIFLGSQFKDGDKGTVFEYELIYYPTKADGNGFKIPQPDGVQGTRVRNLGDDQENYRWNFLIKNNRERDDYSALIAYCKHFDLTGAAFHADVENFVDVDNWLRGMAFAVLSGAGDNYAANSTHNAQFYVRPDGRVIFLPHDMDFSFSTTRSITTNSDVATIVSDPARLRQYLGHLYNIITTTYNNGYMFEWSTHFASLDPAQNWDSSLSHITSRSNNVFSQIMRSIPETAFNITTTDPLTVNGSIATISGLGWIDVRDIRIAGGGEPEVTWTGSDSWQLKVQVLPGPNTITLEAIDFSGEVIDTKTITVNNTSTIEPATGDNLVISEFMYHPSAPTASEIEAGFTNADLFEYIELMNIGKVDVNLDGAQFTSGINYSLPPVTLAPGARVVLARNRTAFLKRHPAMDAALLPGEYGIADTNKLSNGGEQVVLATSAGTDIRRFTYADQLPWAASADGSGFSLVLIAAGGNPDHPLAQNWRSSGSIGGTPGAGSETIFSGDPDEDEDGDGLNNFLDYVLGDTPGPTFTSGTGGSFVFEFHRNLLAEDVIVTVESSTDLVNWDSIGLSLRSAVSLGDGLELQTWDFDPLPVSQQFLRMIATQR